MRICLLSSDYAPEDAWGRGGGIETYVRLMAGGLADAGHEVHVIAPTAHGTRTIQDGAVRVHAIHVRDEWQDRRPELGDARAALSFAWQARRKVHGLMASGGPFDVVEAPEYKGQAFFLADDPAIPLAIKCHAHLRLCLALNGEPLTPATALMIDMEREALRKAKAIHANSRALAARCADDYGLPIDRFVAIPYGIDTQRFTPAPGTMRQTLGLNGQRVVLYVGRLEERKGIVPLVEAFTLVAHSVADAVLVLAGGDVVGPPAYGSNAAWMRDAWRARGVPDERVIFVGPVPHADLPALYSMADVMAAPSPYEAFGLVYLEAMACRCPPIGCRNGGAPEVIRDEETGLLVPPGDGPALAAAIMRLLNQRDRRDALAARGYTVVQEEFSIAAAVKRTIGYYEEVFG